MSETESLKKNLVDALELANKYKAAYELLLGNTSRFLKQVKDHEDENKRLREKVKFYGDKNLELYRIIEDVYGIDVTNLKVRINDLEDQVAAAESERDDYFGLCMTHCPDVLEDN